MRIIVTCLLLMMAGWVQAELKIEQAYVRGLPPGQPNTAAFMSLNNTGSQPLTLTAISSPAAQSVELHTSRQHGDMVHMEKLDSLQIAAAETVVLQPGGHHLMLLGLHQPLAEGDSVILQFSFSDGSQTSAKLAVRSVLNEPAAQQHQHHH
ncbi:copper chaperone PCu(A)C [Dasania sp. GY-MA-18]|uniref:Copper chaperone PCu(A)C n=1 Tax=Dasania phycosphaerae TaxID=2950436 RepID=A0A9J6RMK8_9GAMM|nr:MULTISPECIES: copper chaperone PCu(A)C [Dasania]MCR8922993.1 copper chaperone PCu(A)C [Dasania sp. GY-MA-18]MCZ0865424.1 copper chaperone PCu(A)C [Dasania phycosphaerae]MCZ0869149.1 copper chaperone PCu(A)C [Dasania phycosphaerae]